MSMTQVVSAHEAASGALRRGLLVALMAFFTLVDLFATQAILPALAARYGVSAAAMGTAVNAGTLGMAVSCLAIALLGRRLDRRRGILASLALLSVPTALLASAPDVGSFAALRGAQGVFMAAAFTLTLAHLGERCSMAAASGAFAAYVTGNVASNLVGRLASAGLAMHLGLAGNFYIFSLLNLVGAALAWATLGRAPAAGYGTPMGTAWRAHLHNPRLRAGFGLGFCILFAFIGCFTYVNFALVAPPFGLGMMQLGLVYLVFLPSVLTTPLAGRAVAWAGGPAALLSGLGVAALGLPLLLMAALPAVLAGLVLVAIGTFLAQAVATGLVTRLAEADRGAASGLYLASYFAGGLVGSAVLGWAFMQAGWPGCVAGIGFALGAAAMLARRLRSAA